MAAKPFNDPKPCLKTPKVRAFGVFFAQVSQFNAYNLALSLEYTPLCGAVEGMDADERAYRDVFTVCPAKGGVFQATRTELQSFSIIIKKFGVFIIKALSVFCLAGPVLANCPPPAESDTEWVRLASVTDGDSLRLKDGRRLRLIAVNAPELAREKDPAQALGPEARSSLRRLLTPGDRLLLAYGSQRQDHYGRSLAHVYTATGQHLASYLVRQGLGFHIAIPPNLSLAECLAGLEVEARRQELGVWGHTAWQVKPARTLTPADAGFARISGRVTQVDDQGDLWLELDGPVVVKIAARDRARFDRPPDAWLGQRLTLRGWLVDRSGSRVTQRGFKPLVMSLRTPYALD